MSIGLCYQRLPRQTTGQQTVRPCNNVSSSPFPFIAALPAGRCSPPAHPAMWLQNPRCTTGLPHRRGDWCDPSAMRPYAPGHCPQTAPYSVCNVCSLRMLLEHQKRKLLYFGFSIPWFSLAEKVANQKCPRRACCGSPGTEPIHRHLSSCSQQSHPL